MTIIFSLGLSLVWLAKVDSSEFLRGSLAASGKLESLNESQLEQIEKVQKIMLPVGATVGVLLGVPIVFLLASLLYFAGIKIAGARKVKFRKVFCVYCYSGLISVVYSVLGMVVMLGRPSVSAPPDMVFQANLAFFMPLEKAKTALYQLAVSADLFSIWSLILLIFGLRAITGFSLKRSGTVAISVWFLFVILRVAATMLSRQVGMG